MTDFEGLLGKLEHAEDWGFPGHLTPSETEVLGKFRALLVDTRRDLFPNPANVPEDADLLRWLRARKFDLDKSLKMLEGFMKWFHAYENRRFFAEKDCASVANLNRNGSRLIYLAGRDKTMRPVLIVNICKMYPRQVKNVMEIEHYWVSYVHELTQVCKQNGVVDYTVVADFAGFSLLYNFSIATVKVLLNLLQNYYPERLAYCFVLNVPGTFRSLWAMVQPFIDDRTKAKIHILGSDRKKLLQYIDADQLEKSFGGTAEPFPVPDRLASKLDTEEGIHVVTGMYDPVPETEASSTSLPAVAASTETSKPATPAMEEAPAPPPEAVPASPRSPTKSTSRTFSPRKMLSSILPRSSNRSPKKSTQEAAPASPASPETRPASADAALEPAPAPAPPPPPPPTIVVLGASSTPSERALIPKLVSKGYRVRWFIDSEVSDEKIEADLEGTRAVRGSLARREDVERAFPEDESLEAVIGWLSFDVSVVDVVLPVVLDKLAGTSAKLIWTSSYHARPLAEAWWQTDADPLENLERLWYWKGAFEFASRAEQLISDSKVASRLIRVNKLVDEEEEEEKEAKPRRGLVEHYDAYYAKGRALTRAQLVDFVLEKALVQTFAAVALAGNDDEE